MEELSAQEFAVRAHGEQRYGERPYSVHLAAVAEIVESLVDAGDPLLSAVAWLHDVLEDTAIEAAELRLRFGEVVTEAVALVSDPPGENRRRRKAALHVRLAATEAGRPSGRAALIVKAADRLANARASLVTSPRKLHLYRAEHPAFRDAVHRPGLCDRVWAELDGILGELRR